MDLNASSAICNFGTWGRDSSLTIEDRIDQLFCWSAYHDAFPRSFFRNDSGKWKWKLLCNSLQPHGLYSPWNSPGQNTGMGSRSLLHGIFPTQGSNPGLLHCRWIHYQLSHKGSPRELIFPTAGSSPSCWLSAQVLHKSYPWWEFLTQHHNSLLGQLLFVTHCFGGIKSQSLSPGCDNSKRPV